MEPKKKCTESAVNQDQDRAHRPSTHTTAQVNLNVYIKGVDFDISKHVVKHPIAFKRSLCRVYGDVAEVKLLNGCLRVNARASDSVNYFWPQRIWTARRWRSPNHSEEHQLRDKPLDLGRAPSRPGCSARGIIFGVSSELTEEEICEEVDAASVRRLSK